MLDPCPFDLDANRAPIAAGLTDAIRNSGMTVASMESCTGGLLMSALTREPGSGFLLGGVVAYDAKVKVAFGVPDSLIEKHGVVSRQVALAMAARARSLLGSDLGIGITGEAGPMPEGPEPKGTVFIGVVIDGASRSTGIKCDGERKTVRTHAVLCAITLAVAAIEEAEGARAGAR